MKIGAHLQERLKQKNFDKCELLHTVSSLEKVSKKVLISWQITVALLKVWTAVLEKCVNIRVQTIFAENCFQNISSGKYCCKDFFAMKNLKNKIIFLKYHYNEVHRLPKLDLITLKEVVEEVRR